MENITNDVEKKQYILKSWSLSSGKRIALMLKRYWSKKTPPTTFELAKSIFRK
jgi:hypothetical protein